mgnify:CR=1 FL=1
MIFSRKGQGMVSKLTAFGLTAWLLSACSPATPPGKTYHHSIFTFGTIIDISVHGVQPEQAERVFEQLEKDFHYMHVTWQPWQRSALRRNNDLLTYGEWFADAPSVRPMLARAQEIAIKSDHLFNPAIGKLVRLWGFHRAEHDTGFPPEASEIKKLVEANPRMDDIEIGPVKIRSKNPQVELDFGGFGKGVGIERSISLLRSQGIHNAIINAGGDLKAIGKKGDRPWRIGIRHPRQQDTVLAYLDIEGNESVFSSGDYERYFMFDGKRYHHIIDPRTGYPASGAQSVTVIHADAALADAAATAIFVAGVKDWQRIAAALGIEAVLLVDDQGTIHMTPAMQKRIHFNERDKLNIKVSNLSATAQ